MVAIKRKSSVRGIPLPEFLVEALARRLERFSPGPEGLLALHDRRCSWGLKPPVSSRDLAM